MRLAAILFVLSAAAAPAAAQDLLSAQRAAVQAQINELQAQAELVRQQEVSSHNQLMALDARLRTEQGVADIRSQAYIPRLPPVAAARPATAAAPPPSMDTGQLASIPDAALADSNRRVREAAQNRP